MRNKPNSNFRFWRRRLRDWLATGLAGAAALLVLAPLFAIFAYLIIRGAGALNWAFLVNGPKPVGETGGGIGNAIAGSAVVLGIGSVIGIPLGIGAGVYLAEFGKNRFSNIVRFTADVLNGVPSI